MCGWGYTLATVVVNSRVQAGDVQSRSVLDSHCRREEGIDVGELSDLGHFMRKECSLFHDRSSARTLRVPGRWTAANLKFRYASAKKAQRSRCIICLSFEYLLLRTATTAALSHRATTCLPRHRCPKITAAITMGSSSLAAMFQSRVSGAHSS